MFKALGFVAYTAIVGSVGVLAGAVGLVKMMIFSDKTIEATIEELNKHKTNTEEPEESEYEEA